MADIIPTFNDWADVKPVFYEDSRQLGTSVLQNLRSTEITLDPEILSRHLHRPFYALEDALKTAVAASYAEVAEESVQSCPYHEMLDEKLRRRSLPVNLDISDDTRTFVETSMPGGYEAPVLISNLVGRMKVAAEVHDVDISPQELADNSIGLIQEPLRHPQQWAKAFLFTLVDTDDVMMLSGDAFTFNREGFLPAELLERYTKITDGKKPKLEWSKPLADFVMNAPSIDVYSRTKGSERPSGSANVIAYPQGTRLGDIAVDETTITCPGKPLAMHLWREAARLSAEHQLWDIAA